MLNLAAFVFHSVAEAGGRVTKAARALKLTHQGLCYIINHRQNDLERHLAELLPVEALVRGIVRRAGLTDSPVNSDAAAAAGSAATGNDLAVDRADSLLHAALRQ